MIEFSLLNAFEDNQQFIFEAFKTTIREYAAWAWGGTKNIGATDLTSLPVQNFKLVYVAGSKAGALYVEEHEEHHYIRLMFLLPKFQGSGIGSALLMQEASRAKKAQKSLALKVIKINPAQSICLRHEV